MPREPKYKSADELEEAVEKYFKDCEGEIMRDTDGTVLTDKYGNPVIYGKKPPTVTGLAYALGFRSRQALLNYQGKKAFNDTVTRAKMRIEAYCEGRLFDKDGAKGASFSLEHNFKGWQTSKDLDSEVLEKLDGIIRSIDKASET